MTASARILDHFSKANGSEPIRILGASGQLGYGVPTPAFSAGLERKPHLIGCDMGSIDIGPYYLGSGELATALAATRRDLRKVLLGALKLKIPLIIGSAGSAGAKPHLEQTLAIIREIVREEGLSFRMGVLRADIERTVLKAALRSNGVVPIDGMAMLDATEVDAAANIVGQMGMSAFQRALAAGVDVVVAGRVCDTAIFAALPAVAGFPIGPAQHMAKIIECASLCCVPGGRDSILATLDQEGFELESMAPQRRATPVSVAAHSLYEQSDPFTVQEPEGRLDLARATYHALDDRRTRVVGAVWEEAREPWVKIEGARHVGERAILLCGTADPRFIARPHGRGRPKWSGRPSNICCTMAMKAGCLQPGISPFRSRRRKSRLGPLTDSMSIISCAQVTLMRCFHLRSRQCSAISARRFLPISPP